MATDKQEVKIFISYSHMNNKRAREFIAEFEDYIKPSKKYNYSVWYDKKLRVGKDFDPEILEHIASSICIILLVSTSFLNSDYIKMNELPAIFAGDKIVIPLLFRRIDFLRHDLGCLEGKQIYSFYNNGELKNGKSYTVLDENQRDEYISEVYEKMEDQLDEKFGQAVSDNSQKEVLQLV